MLMETIIIMTVLSTLGAVALVTSIVVAFIKLRKKVDVNDYGQELDNLYNEVNTKFDDTHQTLGHEIENVNKKFDEIHQILGNEIDEVKRFIDSRCDK
jgi:hypothetical protein